jgi:hypothetical protein
LTRGEKRFFTFSELRRTTVHREAYIELKDELQMRKTTGLGREIREKDP